MLSTSELGTFKCFSVQFQEEFHKGSSLCCQSYWMPKNGNAVWVLLTAVHMLEGYLQKSCSACFIAIALSQVAYDRMSFPGCSC